jgi:hypothetical protein
MARGNLVISCGGAGKGALNYLKQTLLDRKGSLTEAGTVLIAIDGPPPETDGPYVLDDGSSLSSEAAHHEFFGLTRNPKEVLAAIADGRSLVEAALPYIASRITKKEAADLIKKLTSMDPPSGMGSCRPVSHANFCMEAPEIQKVINAALERVRPMVERNLDAASGLNVNQTNIFLVGCQMGGTGAGQLLDVGLLTRSKMRSNERLILVLILPDAFNYVLKPDTEMRRYANAKAYCGLIEFARMRKSLGIADELKYNEKIGVPFARIFDLCFLIDGHSAGLDLSTDIPKRGSVPAVSDFIASMILDDKYTSTKLVDWTSTATITKHYSTAGSHVWRFPADRLVGEFSLSFAEMVLRLMLETGDAATRADQRAHRLMDSAKYTQLAFDLEQGHPLPTDPVAWTVLRPRMIAGVNPPIWPCTLGHDALDLATEVRTAGFIFGGPNNAEVKAETDTAVIRYLGKPEDAYDSTVSGWINVNAAVVKAIFAERLIAEIRDLFYARRDDGTLEPRTLNQGPNTIVEADLCLSLTIRMLEKMREAFTRDLEVKGQALDPQQPGVLVSVSTLARRAVDEIEMGKGKDRAIQAQYIAASQHLLEIRVWELLMEAGKRMAADLVELVNITWGWVGDAASGWRTFLQDVCLKAVQLERQRRHTIAVNEDRILCRTSYPRSGSQAERRIFEDLLKESKLAESALEKMQWTLDETVEPSTDPKRMLQSKNLRMLISLPSVEGAGRELILSRDLVNNDVRRIQCSTFSPEILRGYGQAYFTSRIHGMTIWDAMDYVFRYGWLENRLPGVAVSDESRHQFVSDRVQRLVRKADLLLGNAPIATHAVYCLSHYQTGGTPTGLLAAEFVRQLTAAFGGVHELQSMQQEVRILTLDHGLDYSSWSSLNQAFQDYCQVTREGELPSVHVYPNEKFAFELETIISEKVRYTSNLRSLPVEIMVMANDPEVFESFLLALAAELFDRLDDPKHPGSQRYLGVSKPREIPLGEADNLIELASNFVSKTGEHRVKMETLRSEIERRWRAKVSALSTPDAKEKFFNGLLEQVRSAGFLAQFASDPSLATEDLKDVFSAVVMRRAEVYKVALSIQ